MLRDVVQRATVSEVRFEYGVTLGAGEGRPRLSWAVDADVRGWIPDRYEVTLRHGDGSVQAVTRESSEQGFQEWPFEALNSRERVAVQVRVGVGDVWSHASPWSTFEVGLLHESDWKATLITPVTLGKIDDAAPVLFTDISLPSTPVRARLYVTARGLYDFSINRHRVGDAVLTPGWTAYGKRLRYQTYDVTEMLRPGANAIHAVLGNGWYRGQLVWPGNRSSYGDTLGLFAQLEVEFADGSSRIFPTDTTWRAAESGIIFDDFYDGQTRDLRISEDPRSHPSEGVRAVDFDAAELVAPTAPPVRITEEISPAASFRSPSGKLLVDFGQNLVGWVRLTVRGATRGTVVTIRHAEVLEDGELGIRPLRSAKAISRYILSGADEESLVPTFTYHGFRYAEIEGVPDTEALDAAAVVLGTDLRRTGWFESSSHELNQLHQNIVWSMRGNFFDVPTDCPARDERLGWTGDIQVFAPTANFLFDASGFLAGWLRDLAAEQTTDGGVPNVVPDVLREPDPGQAGWGDASTIVPMSLFTAFGDRDVLARQYQSMVMWVEKIARIAGDRLLWTEGRQFGDWLDPTAPPDDPAAAQADPAVVATAYFARSVFIVAQSARILGRPSDAERFEDLYDRIRTAFCVEYVSDRGVVRSDCQTVYALALCWDLLQTDEQRAGSARRLAELVQDADCRISTGFLGTPLILDALEIAGRPDLAMRMLMRRELPSWLYAVGMGATTVWERWDSMLPDGSINPGSMTSFNHYAYGAVADWMHRSVAGLAPLEPGYRRIRVRPNLHGGIDSAEVRHECAYGMIRVAWRRTDRELRLELDIPIGVSAEVCPPAVDRTLSLPSGQHVIRTALG